jgi:uncharacterized protein GlcG (DUF336 family)
MPTLCTLSLSAASAIAILSAATAGPANAENVDIAAAQNEPAVRAAISACRSDASALCASVVPGGGRIIRCLSAQPDKLSPTCRTAMDKARERLISLGALKQ